MLNLFRSATYVPTVKWKLGERMALHTQREKNRLLPLILLPPSKAFDHEKGRALKPLEHIRLFGHRLQHARGRHPVFVDALLIDDHTHRQALDEHPLTALLGRAQMAGATACPATMIGRSSEYQEAVRRFVQRQAPLPICIRVTPLDMDSQQFVGDLMGLLDTLGCGPDRAALVLDFAENVPKLAEVEGFCELLIDRINHLPALHEWLMVVATLTSFPLMPKVKVGETKLFPRTDWMTYRRLLERRSEVIRCPIFGDYAVDATPYGKPVRVVPWAQFRYTIPEGYVLLKGQQARKPIGCAAIYPVADTLARRDDFQGQRFSEGDEFVARLAERHPEVTTGNASIWRWAGTDHHFARVMSDLGNGSAAERQADVGVGEKSTQGSLFDPAVPGFAYLRAGLAT